MAKAIWRGTVLAESDKTVIVEGNHYFPPESVHMKYFRGSEHQSVCPWKGTAGYYNIEVDEQVNENAAWYYPEPSKAAEHIAGFIAFWHGVEIEAK